MNPDKLTLNLLNFAHKEKTLLFYLTGQEKEGAVKLAANDLRFIQDRLSLFREAESLYTTFRTPCEGSIPVSGHTSPTGHIDQLTWSYSILKKYYTHRIAGYFRAIGLPVIEDFVSDVQVWVPCKSPYPDFTGYRTYSLRVQFARITLLPELLVSSGGITSASNHPVSSPLMSEVSPEYYNKIIFRQHIYYYEQRPEEVRRNQREVFPCLNEGLRKALGIPVPTPVSGNKYRRYWNEIEDFKKKYLSSEAFAEIMQLNTNLWIDAPSQRLRQTANDKMPLSFGNNQTHHSPLYGLQKYGPQKLPETTRTSFFYIFHDSDSPLAFTLNDCMNGTRFPKFNLPGLIQIAYATEPKLSIAFKDKGNPLPEIEKALDNRFFKPDTSYMAIYLSPYKKYGEQEEHQIIYHRLKEMLLRRGIESQVIDVKSLWGDKRAVETSTSRNRTGNEVTVQKAVIPDAFYFSLNNIAPAMLAKLGGTPWGLRNNQLNELVIGVGAFRSMDDGKNYLGSAFCFSNEGRLYGFDCFRSEQTRELAGSILAYVKQFCQERKTLSKLTIHFYKKLSNRELAPIEKGLANLGLKIPVYVVSFNKTFSDDILGFDRLKSHLMPCSGTYLSLGDSRYLLYNNALIDESTFKSQEGYPFPMKISIQCFPAKTSDKTTTEDEDTIIARKKEVEHELLNQVCHFSRIYWKSIKKQSMPVTIKYPEMLAQIVPHFARPDIPRTGKETLWFL